MAMQVYFHNDINIICACGYFWQWLVIDKKTAKADMLWREWFISK